MFFVFSTQTKATCRKNDAEKQIKQIIDINRVLFLCWFFIFFYFIDSDKLTFHTEAEQQPAAQ